MFNATATDTGCGVSYLQYKRPTDTSWQNYTSGVNIGATAGDGVYTQLLMFFFRLFDLAGHAGQLIFR